MNEYNCYILIFDYILLITTYMCFPFFYINLIDINNDFYVDILFIISYFSAPVILLYYIYR